MNGPGPLDWSDIDTGPHGTIHHLNGHGPDQPQPEERERTTWWFRDNTAAITGIEDEPAPTQLARQDGHRLFYAGKVNGLIGESESGKTWVALLAIVQALRLGEHVLFIDFEDTQSGIIGRLRRFGITHDQMQRFHYINPDEPLSGDARTDLRDATDAHPYALIVIDGVNAAMQLLGYKIESNDDATAFSQRFLKPLAAHTGAAVCYIDHVPKNTENRGKGGIGAQAKRAMTTGCALRVEAIAHLAPGTIGRLKLTVDKDRPGHVRAVSRGPKDNQNAGTFVLDATDPEQITARIDPPDLRAPEEKGPLRPTNLMEKVSRLLETTLDEGISKAQIGKRLRKEHEGLKSDDKFIRLAIDTLTEERYAKAEFGGPGKATVITSTKPYREDQDPLSEKRQSAQQTLPTDSEPPTSVTSVDLGATSVHRTEDPPGGTSVDAPPPLRGAPRSHRGPTPRPEQPNLGDDQETTPPTNGEGDGW